MDETSSEEDTDWKGPALTLMFNRRFGLRAVKAMLGRNFLKYDHFTSYSKRSASWPRGGSGIIECTFVASGMQDALGDKRRGMASDSLR